ncbi:MAG TPA: hypothetical protein VGI58_17070 [Streptosporangiaceae bacterium]
MTWGSRSRAARSGGSRRIRLPIGCVLWVLALIVTFIVLSFLFGDLQQGGKHSGAPRMHAPAVSAAKSRRAAGPAGVTLAG